MTETANLSGLEAYQETQFFDETRPRASTWDLLDAVLADITAARNYYDTDKLGPFTRLTWWRLGFLLVRTIAFAAVVLAVIAPAIGASGKDFWFITQGNAPTIAYISVLVAGLLLFVDQTFVFSKNWIRYRRMDILMDDIREDFLDKCQETYGAVKPEDYGAEQYTQAQALASEFRDRVRLEKAKDVEAWASNLADAIKALQDKVDAKRKENSTKVEEAQKAREKAAAEKQLLEKKDGAIVVKIARPEEIVAGAKVYWQRIGEDEMHEMDLGTGASIVTLKPLGPGNYDVRITAQRKGADGKLQPYPMSKAVKLDPSGITEVEFA